MIGINIKYLRKSAGLSQEELAEKLGVTRQSVAKWESGDSLPDVMKCGEIAQLFDTTVDMLINLCLEEQNLQDTPDNGRYAFGMVKVGERGQIVIPKAAREVFSITPGDKLIVLGDKSKGGIALAKVFGFENFVFPTKN